MDPGLSEILVCPLCHAPFEWTALRRIGEELQEADARCPSCGIRSGVREGIGFFLPGDAPDDPDGLKERPASPNRPGKGTEAASGPRWSRESEERIASARAWVAAQDATRTGRHLNLPWESDGFPRTLVESGGLRPVVAADRSTIHERARAPDRRSTSWDGLVVERHSLPLADGSISSGSLDLGIQAGRGLRVVLRELRRAIHGPLYAIVVFRAPEHPRSPVPPSSDPEEAMFLEGPLLEEFRRARWVTRMERFGEIGPNPSPESDPSGEPRERPVAPFQLAVIIGDVRR